MNINEFREMALSFPGVISLPHFDRTSFKVTGKRIFATLHEKTESANIVLSPEEQKVFCSMAKTIFAVPNKWGGRGWTTFEIKKTETSIILDALNSAYEEVLKKKTK